MSSKFTSVIQEVEKSVKLNTFKKILRWLYVFGIALALSALLTSAYLFFAGYNVKEIKLQNPIQSPVRFDQPESFLKAPRASKTAVNAKPKVLTVEDKICAVFGSQCATAVAVAKAESGLRCDAQNINKNGSIDLGLMQINSVHLKKGWKAGDLLNCDKNIELAYTIYKGSGWTAWSSYNNNSYKKHLAIN